MRGWRDINDESEEVAVSDRVEWVNVEKCGIDVLPCGEAAQDNITVSGEVGLVMGGEVPLLVEGPKQEILDLLDRAADRVQKTPVRRGKPEHVWRQVNLELRLTPAAVEQLMVSMDPGTDASKRLRHVLGAAEEHWEEKGSLPFRALVELGETPEPSA